MSHSVFISDLHLSDARPATLELFIRFLQIQAPAAESLYILGDLFDAWVGDDDDSMTAEKVRKAIRQLADSGTPVFIMQGNRDFLIGKDFCRACNATLLDDPTLISIGAEKVLLTHGDQLCTRDVNYQKARKMRMQPDWLEHFLHKSLAERKSIAAEYRKLSGEAKSLLAEDIMDVTPSEVDAWFMQYGTAIMIHGHTHRPAIHHHRIEQVTKTRIVLGEWHQHEASAIAIDGELNIQEITIR
jgi:UDP-2,3-diacylglucosamine hydrolase